MRVLVVVPLPLCRVVIAALRVPSRALVCPSVVSCIRRPSQSIALVSFLHECTCTMPPSACFPENYLSCSPSHGAPGHSFVWLSPLRAPSPLLLELPVPPARSRDKHAGTVWNAAIVLADKIAANEIDVRGRKVVELGAGLALPGIVAARKGADKVPCSAS